MYYKKKTIDQVIEENKQNGYHFFDADTMRFFDSRIESELINNQYFITSEKKCFNDFDRVFSVRLVLKDGDIRTVIRDLPFRSDAMEYIEDL